MTPIGPAVLLLAACLLLGPTALATAHQGGALLLLTASVFVLNQIGRGRSELNGAF